MAKSASEESRRLIPFMMFAGVILRQWWGFHTQIEPNQHGLWGLSVYGAPDGSDRCTRFGCTEHQIASR